MLTSALSWSWIFFINVPVGVLVFALAPRLVHESRADVAHRHFDLPGAASITAGLMLLVYAMTRAVQHGWGTSETIGLLAASAALIVAFVAIEARSSAPLLPLRMFRLRTLTGSNIGGLLMGGAVFSQFFLLTLYMQQVLHYSALQTGVAYVALTLADDRVRERLAGACAPIRGPAGAAGRPAARCGGARPLCPPAGRRALLLGSLPGVPAQRDRDGVRVHPDDDRRARRGAPADAGIASGLINTTQQIGGAIGVAAATTIAATYTSRYLAAHPGASPRGAALTHGFEIAFYALAAVAAFAAVVCALVVESKPQLAAEVEAPTDTAPAFEVAA